MWVMNRHIRELEPGFQFPLFFQDKIFAQNNHAKIHVLPSDDLIFRARQITGTCPLDDG